MDLWGSAVEDMKWLCLLLYSSLLVLKYYGLEGCLVRCTVARSPPEKPQRACRFGRVLIYVFSVYPS